MKVAVDPDIVKAFNNERARINSLEKAIDTKQAEARYNIPKGTLANLRSRRQGSKFFKVGSKIYYRITDFENWFFKQPVLTKDSIEESLP